MREAIAQVSETTPVRRILTSVVDVMVTSTAIDMHALCPRLMAYGQSLDYEAKWSVAADVYSTIVAHAHPLEDADLVVAAHLQLGYCLRTIGELDCAGVAYRSGSEALRWPPVISSAFFAVASAMLSIAMARGNMPQAETILSDTISRAEENKLNEVHAGALTDRAFIAGSLGQYERAIRYSYEALELSTMQRDRDRVLNNIATGFRYLGLFDAARDAYLVLAATAQEQYIRWMSELNLMELAADQGIELQFDRYRRDLDRADFTPQLRVTYLLHVGRGYQALGDATSGNSVSRTGDRNGFTSIRLNALLFEAEDALAAAKQPSLQGAVGCYTVVRSVDQTSDRCGAQHEGTGGAVKKESPRRWRAGPRLRGSGGQDQPPMQRPPTINPAAAAVTL